MTFRYSSLAESELMLRRIPREVADEVLRQPQVDVGGGRMVLARAIVDDTVEPAVVVTVYQTSQISKYWRQP